MTDEWTATMYLADGSEFIPPSCPTCSKPMTGIAIGLKAFQSWCEWCAYPKSAQLVFNGKPLDPDSPQYKRCEDNWSVKGEWGCAPGVEFGGMQDGKPVIWAKGEELARD